MKDIRNMTDAEREQVSPPYRWLQIAIVWVGTAGVIFFSGQFIVVAIIGIVATFKGWM